MKNLVFLFLTVYASCVTIAQPSLQEGIRQLENENFKGALDQFTAIAKNDAKNGTVYFYIGEVSYLQDNPAEAEKAYKKGLSINPQCAECKVGMGKILLDQGKKEEAAENFESAKRMDKKNADIYAKIGDAYLMSKNPDAVKAEQNLRNARDMNPKIAKYWAHLGDAYKMAGDNGEAMTAYETAVEKDPTNTAAYISMARIWAAAKQDSLAIEKLKEAIRLSPNDAPPYKDLIELYMRNGKSDQVIPLLTKYTELAGDDIDAKVRLVKFLTYQAKDYDRAIEMGEKLLVNNPDQYTLHRWLAWSYAEKGMWQQSYDHSKMLFEEIMKKEDRKTYASDYEYYAKAAWKLGLIDEAAHIYRKFIELEPARGYEVYGQLAKAYYDAKNYDQAIAYYFRKSETKELTVADIYWLGLAYYYLDKNEQADSCFVKVLSITPDYLPGWKMRIRIALNADTIKPQQFLAKEPYEKYLAIALNDREKNKIDIIAAANYLAFYFVQVAEDTGVKAKTEASMDTTFTQNSWKIYCYKKAIEYYEMVLSLDPSDEDARHYIDILKEQNKISGGR